MSILPTVVLQSNGSSGLFAGLLFFLFFSAVGLAIALVVIAGLWKTFTKAGKPGWAAIVPIYNIYILLEITDNEVWWLVLFLIPVVNIIASVKVSIDLARAFGKDIGFAVGLVFLPFIFYPLLGFGSAQYVGAHAQGAY